ncbi:MAG: fatty acid desaturase, partial [Proteobacteria bacterium]|nr:fatty acid desaturase [Pseudomonadota bacterium]
MARRDAGLLAGTRTLLSNPVHAFFWNNINLHIGHHVYPGVPWYNFLGHL